MKFEEIAKFLNISVAVAKSLAEQNTLPGKPGSEGWETTYDDIERWYTKLSGIEWTSLVAQGEVDPLTVTVHLTYGAEGKTLLKVMKSWEQRRIVSIISHDSEGETHTSPTITVKLREAAEKSKTSMESLTHTPLIESLRFQLKLTLKCEEVVGTEPVIISVSNLEILKFKMANDLSELSQRDREIIRFYLAVYLNRLAEELNCQDGGTPCWSR